MKKNLLHLWLSFLCLQSISHAQTIDTVVVTTKADIPIQKSICTFGKTTVTYNRPLLPDYAEYNFTKIIDGKAPGLQTTNGGGQPGSSAKMLFRGMSGLSDNNAPLIVLDGMPYYGDASSLNTADIKSINILKDAVATFDFGNRSGNGIISIKTKSNPINTFSQRKKLEVNSKFGISTQAIPDYKTLGIKEFYETMNTAIKNTGFTDNVVDFLGGYNAYRINGVGDSLQDEYLIDPATGKLNTNAQLKYQDDWRKEMKRIGIRQEYNIASTNYNYKRNRGYYLSLGYVNDKGYVRQTDFTRYSGKFDGDIQPLKWLTLGLRTNGAIGLQNNANADLFSTTQLMAPVYPVYFRNNKDEKEKNPATGTDKYDWGNLTYFPNSSIGNRNYVPSSNSIASIYQNEHSQNSTMLLLNPYFKIGFLKCFTYTANFGYNYNKLIGKEDNVSYGLNTYHNFFNTLTSKTFIQKVEWDKSFRDHHLVWTLANEFYKYNTKFIDSIGSGQGGRNYSGLKTLSSSKNYYTKIAYDYKSKYFLFAGIRRDGFAYDKYEWSNNWAAGASYALSEENFMKDINWINTLKFKANYGTQERNLITRNQIYPQFLPRTPSFQYGMPGKGNQLNIGLESSLFNSRVSIEANIYSRNSGETILEPYFIPTPGGFQLDYRNTPFKYNNKGIELSIYTTNIHSKSFEWTTRFMLSHNKNTIAAMPSGRDSIITTNNSIYKKGNSMADFYLVEYAGVDPNNGEALYYARDANGNEIKTNNYEAAQMTNRKNMGSAFPTTYGSVTNSFTYKRFELSVQVNYSLGGKYYDQVYQDLMGSGRNSYNWSSDISNAWNADNRNTTVPKLNVNDNNNSLASSRFLKSASYLSIANFYLGYTFCEEKIKKMKMNSLRVFLTANNLWMFTASKGMNPQGSFYGNPGYVYLPARTIMFGVNVGI